MGRKKTIKEFIRDAIKVHGSKYNYSKVDYKNCKTKVIIICKKHGEFLQTPNNHLSGDGCPECGGTKKKTTEEFVKIARKIRGYKYDYSKVNYKTAKEKIIIICKEHGEFLQTPNSHLAGNGCPKCGKSYRPTTKEFIKQAIKVHGNKYDYSKVDYKKAIKKIIIICKKHGEFLQAPSNHLSGQNCPICAGNKKKTTEKFIKDAIKVHGDKYDYSKVEYIRTSNRIIIICKEHGEFFQTPNSHLAGNGCPKCSGNKKKTTEEFIKDAIKVHGSKYDYSKSKYISAFNKIIIICEKHGEFLKIPDSHINKKSGCPKCNRNNISIVSQKWLDSLEVPENLREKYITIQNKTFILDALDIKNKIVYEFNGDFWHGNPNKYNPNDINPVNKTKFGELFRRTMEKKNLLEKNGFKVISIWESEFDG